MNMKDGRANREIASTYSRRGRVIRRLDYCRRWRTCEYQQSPTSKRRAGSSRRILMKREMLAKSIEPTVGPSPRPRT